MRHPFDGINAPRPENRSSVDPRSTRRSVLARAFAAVAGIATVFLSRDASAQWVFGRRRTPPTTLALGEEGGYTTFAVGEEGGYTTFALGEEGGTTYQGGNRGNGATTYAVGEEGGPTTYAVGEEGGPTTYAVGEEGGYTTFALGEEGGGRIQRHR